MKTTVHFLVIFGLAFLLSQCKNSDPQPTRITIIGSHGNDTSITISDPKNKAEIEEAIYKLTHKKVSITGENPKNIYVFSFTDDDVTLSNENVYVVDVHDIMQKLDTAIVEANQKMNELRVNIDSVMNQITQNLKDVKIRVDSQNIAKLKTDLLKSTENIKNTRIIVVTGENDEEEKN